MSYFLFAWLLNFCFYFLVSLTQVLYQHLEHIQVYLLVFYSSNWFWPNSVQNLFVLRCQHCLNTCNPISFVLKLAHMLLIIHIVIAHYMFHVSLSSLSGCTLLCKVIAMIQYINLYYTTTHKCQSSVPHFLPKIAILCSFQPLPQPQPCLKAYRC